MINRQIARTDGYKFKKTILIDLDWVLNSYTGNFDADYIPPIKSGAKEFLTELADDFDIKLFTTRNKLLAAKWLIHEGLDGIISDITNTKDLSYLYIDDRCICFNGDYYALKSQIQDFKPWYKN